MVHERRDARHGRIAFVGLCIMAGKGWRVMMPPMLRYEWVICDPAKNGCGIEFERLVTQVDRVICADCRPPRRKPIVPGRTARRT